MLDGISFGIVKDVVLFALAIWGAGLSTYSFLSAKRKDARSIAVRQSTVMHTFGSSLGPPIARLEAINTGHRVVTVSTLTFETSTGGRIFPLTDNRFVGMKDTPLPTTLGDGQSAQMHLSYEEIADALISNGKVGKVSITPICVDSTGGVHRGEVWHVDTDELTRMGRAG